MWLPRCEMCRRREARWQVEWVVSGRIDLLCDRDRPHDSILADSSQVVQWIRLHPNDFLTEADI